MMKYNVRQILPGSRTEIDYTSKLKSTRILMTLKEKSSHVYIFMIA